MSGRRSIYYYKQTNCSTAVPFLTRGPPGTFICVSLRIHFCLSGLCIRLSAERFRGDESLVAVLLGSNCDKWEDSVRCWCLVLPVGNSEFGMQPWVKTVGTRGLPASGWGLGFCDL